MQTKPEPMLSALTELWKEKGWSLSSLRGFRMEDPPAPPAPPAPTPPTPTPPVPPAPTPPAPPAPPDKGFPDNTPIAEMTIEQEAAYWKYQSRKHEQRATERADYDAIKAKADQYDTLAAASQTEQERAIATAREEEATKIRAEERVKNAPLLVNAKIEAAAAAKLTPEQLKPLLDNLDPTKFLTDTGDVDGQKVADFVASIPGASTGTPPRRGFPNLGQGQRPTGDKPSTQAGADRYAARHNKTTPPPAA